MTNKSVTTIFREYSVEDKAALKELQGYMMDEVGKEIPLKDAIAAVEPGLETPEYLKKL